MSLESALQETKQRFQEEQAKKAREDEERRGFVKRVVIALRAPGAAAVETMEELQRMLSEAASVHIEALRRSYPNMDRLILAPNVSTYSSLGGHVLVLGPDQVIIPACPPPSASPSRSTRSRHRWTRWRATS